MSVYSNDVYFASYEQGDPKFLDALLDKVTIYRKFLESSGKLSRWQRSIQNYYGVSSDGSKSSGAVTRGGDQGQLTMAKVNDYRNLIQHQLILITSQRPAGEAKAINSDPTALKQARIASSLIEYYLSQVGYEQKFVRVAETTLVADESFFVIDWNATAGDPVRPMADQDGNPISQMAKTGDLEARVFSPWNVARDPYMGSPDDMKWAICSWRVNKYDLVAKFPQYEDSILKGTSRKLKELVFNTTNENDTDMTEIHCLYHDRTDSVQGGRITLFVPDQILLDGDFPYNEFNVYRMSQNDAIDSCFGYSNNNDLLALEEVTDALYSVIISNQTAFGAQTIIAPKGANIDHTQLSKGFAFLEVDPAHIDKVKALNLVSTAPEIFKFIETLSTKKETIAGINSVVRGDPEGALRSNSGSALALVQAQSIQYQSGGQRSLYQLMSKACTGMILMLQQFAQSERVIRITGKVAGQYLEEFKYDANSLDKVSAVVFELTNPLEKTIGGKEGLAKDLLAQKGMIKNARQYITLARTGNMDAFIEDDEADELALKSENQYLRDGKPIQVVATENHEEHIQSHMSVIASPESKANPDLKQAVLNHIQEHVTTWQTLSQQNPALLIATHQQVLPPPPPQMGAGPSGQQGPPPGSPPPGPTPLQHPPSPMPPGVPAASQPQNPQKMMNPVSPGMQQAAAVKQPSMPQMPINPLSKQRAPGPQGP